MILRGAKSKRVPDPTVLGMHGLCVLRVLRVYSIDMYNLLLMVLQGT